VVPPCNSYHPKAWKIAKGILLKKPNKTDTSAPKSYRVISLLNCLGKVTEKAVATWLSDWCKQNQILHVGQFGCRRGRGTLDALAQLVSFTEEAWAKKQLVAGLLLDVKGAFDHVNRKQLLTVLKELKLPSNLLSWVASFLTDRQVTLVIDGFECPTRDIAAGLPQGSPVSPILFIIYISRIFQELETRYPKLKALSFVDNITLLMAGISI